MIRIANLSFISLDLRSVYNKDTAKLFQLLHQCQERALTIISTHGRLLRVNDVQVKSYAPLFLGRCVTS